MKVKYNLRSCLKKLKKSLNNKYYYVTIMACLAIPDICGAIGSEDGIANSNKYKAWFDKYVSLHYSSEIKFTGELCYYLRCVMLHQGITENKKIKAVFAVSQQENAYIPPLRFNNEQILIEPKYFCQKIIYAAYNWLDTVYSNKLFKKNMKKFMTLYSINFLNVNNTH